MVAESCTATIHGHFSPTGNWGSGDLSARNIKDTLVDLYQDRFSPHAMLPAKEMRDSPTYIRFHNFMLIYQSIMAEAPSMTQHNMPYALNVNHPWVIRVISSHVWQDSY